METQGNDDPSFVRLPGNRERSARGKRRWDDEPDGPCWADWLELLSYAPQVTTFVGPATQAIDVAGDRAGADGEPLLTQEEMRRLCDRVAVKLQHPRPDWRQLARIERILTIVAAELEVAVQDGVARRGDSREMRLAEAALTCLNAHLRRTRLYHFLAPRAVVRHELRQALRSAVDVLALLRRVR